ncbi:hypothetical protein [Pedobacter panaciterrae]
MDTEEFEITRLHTQFLEEIIKDEPAYWLWSHRRWKHKPVQMPEPSLKTDILYSDV